jgi:transcriptional regulator with XRE-family HTH domain
LVVLKIRDTSELFAKALTGLLEDERLSRKLSHEGLARTAGIHRSTVSRIESGQMRPTLEVVYALSLALDLDFQDLVRRASEAARKREH